MSSGSLSLFFFLKVQQTEAVFSCTCVIKSELMKKIIIASHPQHCTSMHCRDCKCVRCGITKGILCPATGKKNPPEFSEISRNISTLLNSFAGYWKLDREFTCRNRVTHIQSETRLGLKLEYLRLSSAPSAHITHFTRSWSALYGSCCHLHSAGCQGWGELTST